MIVRLATLEDVEKLVDHDLRHMQEDGYNGQLAHPFPKNFPFEKEKMFFMGHFIGPSLGWGLRGR